MKSNEEEKSAQQRRIKQIHRQH